MTQIVKLKPEPDCPECGAKPMKLRTRRTDGVKFWGCRNFPECKGTRNIDDDGNPIYDEITHPKNSYSEVIRHYDDEEDEW